MATTSDDERNMSDDELTEDAETMTIDTVYSSCVQLLMNSETISWTRLNNFLVFNTILIVSWVMVYGMSSSVESDRTSACSLPLSISTTKWTGWDLSSMLKRTYKNSMSVFLRNIFFVPL